MAKYTGPTQSYQREFSDYSDAVQWYSNIITQSYYLLGYKTCETGHLELPNPNHNHCDEMGITLWNDCNCIKQLVFNNRNIC